jgi:pimeloyl-ACP methyl ester carboxylesterase
MCCASNFRALPGILRFPPALRRNHRCANSSVWYTSGVYLKNVIHIGHSTGGGEVTHYLARHGENRVAKAALLCAVPPLMVKTPNNPNGLPKQVFDDLSGGARGQSFSVLSRRSGRSLLRLQSAGCESLGGGHRELVAPGYDGRRQGARRAASSTILTLMPSGSLYRRQITAGRPVSPR